jgi:glycerol dehydrogenase-like iron-containing ADH family enzyme
LSHGTIKHTLIEYADYTGKWVELGSKLSKMLFLDLHSLEEEMIERIRERLRSGELLPTFKDLMYISIALDKAWQQADRARDRSETVPEKPGVTHEQYQATVAAAKERMKELKRLEAVG